MDFYRHTGKMALGSRLRRLSEKFTEDARKIYALYGVTLDPKWFPVFYVLAETEEVSITEIADIIGHTHPSVSKIVKEMKQKGLVVTKKSPHDARVSIATLSDTGKHLIPDLERQYKDVTHAVEHLLSETTHDLWKAIEEMEFLLTEKSFFHRVKEVQKTRECSHIELIAYSSEFQADFKRLNCEWIETYFELEEADSYALDKPYETIIHPGGYIYLARYQGEIVGTCALLKKDEEIYELAKMAVTERVRGKGVGWLLGQASLSKARELGAKMVYLESNTSLEPAIQLYKKLGFRKIVGQPSPYTRCNIQMELRLK